ncbi:MAG: ribose 5-phosphate isomerase B [Deltaproteobacteria bacterium]|nr:ribose 5-phosphate isomerase B [Deltaproteobacteria bacterium]
MRLVMACDHGGYQLKDELKEKLEDRDVTIEDLGTSTGDSVDYPDFAHALSDKVLAGEADLGLLICGTGLGMSMAANRHRGIRAAVCTDPYMARMAREHNDANVLCLGARVIGPSLALEIVGAFLDGQFGGDRHARRVGKIEPA